MGRPRIRQVGNTRISSGGTVVQRKIQEANIYYYLSIGSVKRPSDWLPAEVIGTCARVAVNKVVSGNHACTLEVTDR